MLRKKFFKGCRLCIADVTVDACVAQNSSNHPSLAAYMQSLCELSASIGSLVGFSFGIFVDLIGPQINQNFLDAGKAMWKILIYHDVWRPCLYMYLSFSMCLSISEGTFYWVTNSKAGPSFSQAVLPGEVLDSKEVTETVAPENIELFPSLTTGIVDSITLHHQNDESKNEKDSALQVVRGEW
ncbi:unnamed protein product [Fraxinus pennsylvanica]|uniref:Uncharacterized protein n=1 Tax=Fraxinus pennsylvanica TaxID=56036 RepID=A0AAD1YQP3_9LAMI|nr:unnamed protein product [Fraxinus pennsylvanica]